MECGISTMIHAVMWLNLDYNGYPSQQAPSVGTQHVPSAGTHQIPSMGTHHGTCTLSGNPACTLSRNSADTLRLELVSREPDRINYGHLQSASHVDQVVLHQKPTRPTVYTDANKPLNIHSCVISFLTPYRCSFWVHDQ